MTSQTQDTEPVLLWGQVIRTHSGDGLPANVWEHWFKESARYKLLSRAAALWDLKVARTNRFCDENFIQP